MENLDFGFEVERLNVWRQHCFPEGYLAFVTVRKRSLRRLCFYTCLSAPVHAGIQPPPGADTSPPPPPRIRRLLLRTVRILLI